MSILSKPYFHDEAAAFAHIESVLWADGRACPHCGTVDNSAKLDAKAPRRRLKNKDGSPKLDSEGNQAWRVSPKRHGLYKCYDCRKQFTVRKGTIFEESHLPMTKWLQAIFLMVSSKKGFSAHQMHRVLEVQYKTAWFLCHRIREAMRGGDLDMLGGDGKHVEADETYFGKKEDTSHATITKRGRVGHSGQRPVVSLVERGGSVRSFYVPRATKIAVGDIVAANINRETTLNTDESRLYGDVGKEFAVHQTVRHTAGEYVRGDAYTNTIEGYFSIFKRGMKGVYQHCKEKHLHRYLAEFDFRYNNRSAVGVEDGERAIFALRGVVGKRLTYQGSSF